MTVDHVTVTTTVQNITIATSQPTVTVASVGVQGLTGPAGLVPVFTRQNDISVVTGKARFYFDSTRIISQVRASLGTPATGSAAVIDTLVNGTSIGTTSIPAGSNTATISISKTVNASDYATISILSVGSTYSGGDLTVTLTIN